ncbi:MAG: nucleotidyltransferase family protein, partial [Anaerolineales bacterium]
MLKKASEQDRAAFRLMALCSRLACDAALYERIASQAAALDPQAWGLLPHRAETHGIAPLLFTHLKAASAPAPIEVERALRGLALRHRLANRARMAVLRSILERLEAAGISVCVLKGAALAHLIYPTPGLRPMRDVDLLVRPSEARRAQRLLREMGFVAPPAESAELPDKHMAAASLDLDETGFVLSVEVHHNLFLATYPLSMTLDDLTGPPQAFDIDGQPAYALDHADMLWHLCQHTRLSSGVFGANRLIWVADIVGYAEHFASEIDWTQLAARYPIVINTLSLLHFLTPLSEKLLASAPIPLGAPPRGIGLEFEGWPRTSLAAQREKGAWRILRDTFAPPAWWLRLYYGLGSAAPLVVTRWLRHPWHILGWVAHLIR